MAKIVKNSHKTLKQCAEYLHVGKLVSFPTETVYGLGASLWQEAAILNIFKAKERPLTDPLIVHLADVKECEKLIQLNEFQRSCFNILSKKFWPGPLTMVLSASDSVPKSVMAGGDYVGIRIPAHKIAQKFLKLSKVPIAAPSANKFGHVSPTSAQHVFDDLKDVQDLLIIQDDINCDVGIESSVIKIEKAGKIKLLRPGFVSFSAVIETLQKSNISFEFEGKIQIVSRETLGNVSRETFQESSGQHLKHYSPWKETYIFMGEGGKSSERFPLRELRQFTMDEIKASAFVDFGKKYEELKNVAHFYKDLSETGNIAEAARNLFHVLRNFEQEFCVKTILIAHFFLQTDISIALYDRIYRSASGKFAIATHYLECFHLA